MDRFFLSIGALSYAGVAALALTQLIIYIPATMILPLVILTGLGISAMCLGLLVRGSVGFYSAGAFMVSGFVLGALGLFSWGMGNIAYTHTEDVCMVSKITPYDPYAQWACPQVLASYFVMWTLAVGLVIPSLLFFVVPSLAIQRRQQGRETKGRVTINRR